MENKYFIHKQAISYIDVYMSKSCEKPKLNLKETKKISQNTKTRSNHIRLVRERYYDDQTLLCQPNIYFSNNTLNQDCHGGVYHVGHIRVSVHLESSCVIHVICDDIRYISKQLWDHDPYARGVKAPRHWNSRSLPWRAESHETWKFTVPTLEDRQP